MIVKVEEIGLRIHVITSDMGPANQAMWRAYGIHASWHSVILNFCTHPVDSSRKLFFCADPPHVFKNAKTSFLTNQIVRIDDQFVINNGLPSNIVQSLHLNDILKEDRHNEWTLAPKFNEQCLDTSNQYKKMRVGFAKQLFSEQVASGLEFLATDHSPSDSRFTTAFFIDFLAKLFLFMTGRTLSFALSLKNSEKLEKTINFFETAIVFF